MLKSIIESSKQLVQNETKGRLDISIKAVGKWATTDKKVEQLLNTELSVQQKTDGVKLTVLRTDTEYDNSIEGFQSNWVFAYKGNIIFLEEFDYASKSDMSNSKGSSQFRIVLEHFKKRHLDGKLKDIRVNTELFIEFMMNKPTLSSNYEKSHGMMLIGYTSSSYTIKNSILVTKPNEMITKDREKIAKILSVDVPKIIYSGTLRSKNFLDNILDKRLKPIYDKFKPELDNIADNTLYLDIIRRMFLELESIYGGKEEGVILTADDGSFMLKFQQEYQLDQTARDEIKNKFRMSPEEEKQYWLDIRLAALDIVTKVGVREGDRTPIRTILKNVSAIIKKQFKIYKIKHLKKDDPTIKDDLQLTVKNIIVRKLQGNNGALIIGKFRVLTIAHAKIIRDALKDFDTVNVVIVTNKETIKNFDLTKKMLTKTFGDTINIQTAKSGNLTTLLNKFSDNINTVIAGSDRVDAYKKMLERMFDMNVKEITRNDLDISASKVIAKLDDKKYFEKNTPKEIKPLYKEILKAYS